jgi:hypothetical protein
MRSVGPVLVTATLALAVGADSGARATATCTPSWQVVATANVPHLASVAAISPTDVWAVGTKGRRDFPQTPVIAHWDGHELDVIQAFRPSIPVGSFRGGKHPSGSMNGIAALSSRDVWGVGTDGGGTTLDLPVVEHWDGDRWQIVRTPALSTGAELTGVTALSHRNVWAVGHVGTRPLAERWNGRRWRVVDLHRGGEFYAVDGASPGDIWAVGAQGVTAYSAGSGLLMHWNGSRWREIAEAPSSDASLGQSFGAIDAVSATEAWAIHFGSETARDNVQRWDGRRWSVAHVIPGQTRLEEISAMSPLDVWAVGMRSTTGSFESNTLRPLIVHKDGRSWRAQDTPFERLHASLYDISALSPSEIWAAGDHLIARYSC